MFEGVSGYKNGDFSYYEICKRTFKRGPIDKTLYNTRLAHFRTKETKINRRNLMYPIIGIVHLKVYRRPVSIYIAAKS